MFDTAARWQLVQSMSKVVEATKKWWLLAAGIGPAWSAFLYYRLCQLEMCELIVKVWLPSSRIAVVEIAGFALLYRHLLAAVRTPSEFLNSVKARYAVFSSGWWPSIVYALEVSIRGLERATAAEEI